MRMTRYFLSASVLTLLLCGSIALGQTVPATAVPYITEVTPPSLPPGTNPSTPSNFTLTIIGANFTPNDTVNLASSPSYILHPSITTVNTAGSQITAQFSNTVLGSPATFSVTVTNPSGNPPSTSNTYYLSYTPPQPGVVLNQNTTTYLSGTPTGIVVAKLRGNGLPDFAVVSQNTNTVAVEWSDYNGPFLAGGTYTTGNQPSGIVAGDFFGTGQLGLAVVNSADNTVTILLPNGDGTFRPGNTISLPGIYPTQLVAADFNGDGKIDLAVLNTCGSGPAVLCFPAPAQFPGSVTILLGNGDGTFSVSPIQSTTGHNPDAIAAADLNGDGILDLVVVNTPDFSLTLLMGNGDGTFTAAAVSPLTGNFPRALAIGDFNGDGYPDIAVADSTDSAVAILLNQKCPLVPLQQCTFAAPVSISTGAYPLAIATGDVNADGFLDLVVVNGDSYSVSVLLGDGKGGFNAAVHQGGPDFSTGALPTGVVLGDFNQDGRLDIVTINTSGSYSYLRQAAVAQVVLTTDLANPIYGQVPTFTATLNPPPGPDAPTGTLTFYDGSTPIGTVSLSGYRAVLQYFGLSAGAHQVTAVYSGDTNFVSVVSNAVTETVGTAQTTTTLNSNLTNVAYGLPLTLTAAVQPQTGGGTATGPITFFDTTTSTDVGDVALVNNTAQLTLSNLPAGTHVLVANYPGDANLNPSSSPTLTITVTQASSTTTLTSYTNPSTFNQPISLSATVQPSPSGTATGSVSFYDGAALIGTATLANNLAQIQTSTLAGGSHSITAHYSGDTNIAASTSSVYLQTVNPAPSTTAISASLNPSIYGQSVVFTASVRSAISQLSEGQLSLYDGSTLLGTVNLATTSPVFIPNFLKAGTHSITAQYSGTSNYAASSSTSLTQTVNQDTTTTTVAALPNPSSVGQTVNVNVGVNPTHYYGSSGGTVTLFDNGTSIGTATLSMGGSVLFTFTGQTAGTHTLTASYGGDSNLLASTSANFTQTVNPAATTNSISLSSNATTYGQSVTITSTVHAAFGGSPTGTITFLDGSTALGAVSISNGSAQFTSSALSVASHSITAKYNGDSNFSVSTSSPQTVTVSPASTTTTASVDINPATYGQTVTLSAAVQLSSGSGATGSIWFFDGATSLGTATLSSGSARLPVSSLAAGSHSITAKYSGDANFAASTSPVLTETVNPAATFTSVASAVNPAVVGQSVTFTATVQPPAGTTAAGTVNFLDGTTSLGSATLSSNTAQLTVSTLLAGSHSITAVFSGSANLSASTSTALSETINPAPTSITFTTSPNPTTFGQAVRFVATVQPTTGGTVTGTVTFWDGTTAITTAQVVNNGSQYNQATLLDAGFQGGTHTITATYSGDANFSASTSAATSVTVNPAASTVSIASSQNPAPFGQSVTLTAAVQPSLSGDLASGSVTFFDGANSLGTANLSNDSAQLTISNLSQGAHSLTVKYNGDSNFASSTSSTLTQTISQASTATTLASGLNPASFAQSITFSVSVQPSAGGTPTGTVTLMDGATSLASGTLSGAGGAQITVGGLSAGSHSITAVYGGDANFTSSTSATLVETVNAASTTTTISSSANPSAFHQAITFTAVVQLPAGTTATGSVTFMDGSTSLGSAALSSNSAQLTLSALTTGTHAITAVYSGNANLSASTSAALSQVVNAASTTTSVTSSQTPSAFGQSVTFTATIQTAFGSSPTGTVTFLDGAATLATVSVSGNAAQLSLSGLSLGSHSITAKYNGDPNFTASTSASFAQSVTQAATTTNVTSNSNPSSYGQSVTFSALVSPAYTGIPTGTVTFFDGGTSLGSAGLSGGVATLTTAATSLLAGSHSITANYNGDSNFLASASTAFTQIVNPAATSTTLSSSANSSAAGKSVTFTANVSSSVTGTLTGTVNFYLDGGTTPIASSSLSVGSAHFSTSSLGAGFHTLTAAFISSNSNFGSSTSASLMQSITDFTITASPSSNTISRGSSGTYTLTLTPLGGLTGNVLLTCSGAPSNGSCAISPSTVALDGTNPAQAIVTVTVNHNAGTGTRTLTFKGTAGTTTHSTTVTLHIN